jgi:PAS domain-containing protein
VLDENNYTTFVNKKMCEMLEYSRKEIMGSRIIILRMRKERKWPSRILKEEKEGSLKLRSLNS